jgi:GNAT superfamily N-acetyltransferase
MNLTNLFMLKIRTEDFNSVADKPELLKRLRKLTLHPGSGMNHEINNMVQEAKIRTVDAKVLMAFKKRELVGWALLSKEPTDYTFRNSWSGFQPGQGVLLQVFVNPSFRRQGIGSALVKASRKKAGPSRLCICPWDYQSEEFYKNFEHYKHTKL